MDQRIVQSAKKHYIDWDTEDLLALWLDNDRELLSAEGFEAIRQILSTRLEKLPEQRDWDKINKSRSIDVSKFPVESPPPVPRSYRPATPVTRLLQASAVMCAVIGFLLFLAYKYIFDKTDIAEGGLVITLVVILGVSYAQLSLAKVARNQWIRSKRLRIPLLGEAAASRNEPPIVYLRPFSMDHAPGMPEPGVSFTGLGILKFARLPTYEEMMVVALDEDGPVFAIGEPGKQEKSPAGAIREYFAAQTWRDRVVALINQAQTVVLAIGTSRGLLYELEAVCKHRGTQKLILVWNALAYGPTPSKITSVHRKVWSEFRQKFEEITGVSLPQRIDFDRTLLLCFPPNQELRIVIGSERTAWEWYAAFRTARNLIAGNEANLVPMKLRRHIVPWIIFAWYLFLVLGGLLVTTVSPELRPWELETHISLAVWFWFMMTIKLSNLAAAILLLMNKRSAVWVLTVCLILSFVTDMISGHLIRPIFADHPDPKWIQEMLFGYGVSLAICAYSWELWRRGALR